MDTEKLIKLVKENPALYNNENKKYRDTNFKEKIWEKIALEMKTTAPVCRRRWNSLRDQWRKIRKKHTPAKKYIYDDEMSFLTPFLREHDPTGPILYETPIENPREDPSDVQEGSESNADELMKYLHDSDSEPSRRPEIRDPIDSFFDTVKEKVKRFTPYYRNVAETKIFTLVQQMEMEQILKKEGNVSGRREEERESSDDDDKPMDA